MSQDLQVVGPNECAECDGVGLVRAMNESGQWISKPCACQQTKREDARIAAARIPPRYRDASIDTFETGFTGAHSSLGFARMIARKFVDSYPNEKGLLFTGGLGTGKTHLAIGVLRRLIKERGVRGYFCDHNALIQNIKQSFDPGNNSTEHEILKPVLEAEVLVLDELGATRPTDWVRDGLLNIISTRYNNKRSTIVTTNYVDRPVGQGNLLSVERSAREETLGERIGDRLLSRLAEMCITVNMQGEDFRRSVKPARVTDLKEFGE